MSFSYFFFFHFFFAGFSGHICSVCRGEPRQCVDCRESFHFHLSFQHPPISPGHAAHAHCGHCASEWTTTTRYTHTYNTRRKNPLTCSLALQTMVSKKRLEKFLGGEDLETDIVRHDSSFSTFNIYTCSSTERWSLFTSLTHVQYMQSCSLCISVFISSVSIC